MTLSSLDACVFKTSFCMTWDFNSGEVINSACDKRALMISFHFDKPLK